MKKFIFSLLFITVALCANAKHIYYPVYIGTVEIYSNDSLISKKTVIGESSIIVPMLQEGCTIRLTTPSYIDYVRKSINERRQANANAIAGVLSTTAAIMNAGAGIHAGVNNNGLTSAAYIANSVFFTSNAYTQFGMMKRFKELAKNSLVIPAKCIVANNTNKMLRGNIIVKPKETQELSNTNYVDEWRFSDNENNIYCVKLSSVVIRDEGWISQKERVAFVKPTKEEKYENWDKIKRINLDTYEEIWVNETDPEFKRIKKEYKWDKGYNDEK